MASKLFGGVNLSDVAKQVKERAEPSPFLKSPAQPRLAAAELALTGRAAPTFERENILSVDPKRCRPWKYHNRSNAWYTKERCEDLIDSMGKDGQLEPALAFYRAVSFANLDRPADAETQFEIYLARNPNASSIQS